MNMFLLPDMVKYLLIPLGWSKQGQSGQVLSRRRQIRWGQVKELRALMGDSRVAAF